MPILTEKPWFVAVCIPVAILGTSALVTFMMLGQIDGSAASHAEAGHAKPADTGHGAGEHSTHGTDTPTAEAGHAKPADPGHGAEGHSAHGTDTPTAEAGHAKPADTSHGAEGHSAHGTDTPTAEAGHAKPADTGHGAEGHSTHGTDTPTAEAGHAKPVDTGHGAEGHHVKAEKHAHWSHDKKGAEGPAHWGAHSPGEIAVKGIRQSPINILSKSAITSPDLNAIGFHYGNTEFTIQNNGHTIQVDCPEMSNTISVGGHNYGLLQFHFHARSEHLIDGKPYPMELHFVHILSGSTGGPTDKSAAKLAVVGVMIEEGPPNPLIDKLWEKLPAKSEKASFTGPGMNFDILLPPLGKRSFFRYYGSLTTPPCTENVLWSVMEKPIHLSKEQIDKFTKLYKDNYRPDQKVNQRFILRYNDGQSSTIAPVTPPVAPVFPGLPGDIK